MKKLLVGIFRISLVTILFVISISAYAQNLTAEEYKSQIKLALEVEDYEKAVVICNQAIENYPDDADFWYYKGFAIAELKQFDEAMEVYRTADRLKPFEISDVEFENEEARKQYELGKNNISNPDLATQYFLESNKLEPENPMAIYEAGISYLFDKKNYPRAIKCFKKALEVKPDDQAIIALGTAYYKAKIWEKARFYSEVTITILPDYNHRDSIEERIKECEKHLNE
jgi:tetratricopeptide (TPR) repeat protein